MEIMVSDEKKLHVLNKQHDIMSTFPDICYVLSILPVMVGNCEEKTQHMSKLMGVI